MNTLPKLSLLQLMKAVAYCAVAFALIGPMLRLWQIGAVNGGNPGGLLMVAIFEAVIVPLAWVALSIALIKRGTFRDGLITSLLLCSVSVALAFGCWSFFAFALPTFRASSRSDLPSLALHGGVVLVLAAAVAFLGLRLYRRIKWSEQK